LLLINE